MWRCRRALAMFGLALVLLVGGMMGVAGSSVTVGGRWSMVKPLPYHQGDGVSVFLDPAVGGCGADCGKVLFTTGAPVGGDLLSYDPNNPDGGWTKLDAGPPFWVLAGIQLTGLRCVMAHACGKVLFVGAPTDLPGHATLYDPSTHTWEDAGSVKNRGEFAATKLLDGRVLVIGGNIGNTSADGQKGTETWDPVTNLWTDGGDLGQGRYDFAATVIDGPACHATPAPRYCGEVLAAGGWKANLTNAPVPGEAFAAQLEIYDPTMGQWTSGSRLVSLRESPTATLLHDGRVLIAGGLGPAGTPESSAEIYDPALGISVPATPMTAPRDDASAVLLPSGKVLMIGGGPVASAELYDPITGRWMLTLPSPSTPREDATASLIPGQCGESTVIVAGGKDQSAGATSGVTSVDLFTPSIPHIDRISPAQGPIAGGQQVTISGTGLLGVLAVKFGGTPALVVPGGSDTQITVTTPPHAEGTVDVSATSLDGSPPPCHQYTYMPGPYRTPPPNAPTITGSPTLCVPPTGGPLALTGSKLTSSVGIQVNGNPVPSTANGAGTQIVATVPQESGATITVQATFNGTIFYTHAVPICTSWNGPPPPPPRPPVTYSSVKKAFLDTNWTSRSGLVNHSHSLVAAPPSGFGSAPGPATVPLPNPLPGGAPNLVVGAQQRRPQAEAATENQHAMVARRAHGHAQLDLAAATTIAAVSGCFALAARRRPRPRRCPAVGRA